MGYHGSYTSSLPHGIRPRRSLPPPLRTSGPSTSSSPSLCRRVRSQVWGVGMARGGCGDFGGAMDQAVEHSGVRTSRPRCPADTVTPGEVRMPSGKTARPNITDNKDGTVTVRYAPTEKGLHEMDIRYDGNHIPGETRGLLGPLGGG